MSESSMKGAKCRFFAVSPTLPVTDAMAYAAAEAIAVASERVFSPSLEQARGAIAAALDVAG